MKRHLGLGLKETQAQSFYTLSPGSQGKLCSVFTNQEAPSNFDVQSF